MLCMFNKQCCKTILLDIFCYRRSCKIDANLLHFNLISFFFSQFEWWFLVFYLRQMYNSIEIQRCHWKYVVNSDSNTYNHFIETNENCSYKWNMLFKLIVTFIGFFKIIVKYHTLTTLIEPLSKTKLYRI